jgi:hypothetical protein
MNRDEAFVILGEFTLDDIAIAKNKESQKNIRNQKILVLKYFNHRPNEINCLTVG